MTDSSMIRMLRRDEYPLAARFLREHWQENHIYCRSRSLFDWTFAENPAWHDPDHYSFSIAEHEGEIIGVLGTIPFGMARYGVLSEACWLVNWKVRDDCRSTGAGLGLLKIFRDRGWGTVSFAINDTIARLYRGLRWNIIDNIPRLIWIPADNLGRLEHLCALCGQGVSRADLAGLAGMIAIAPGKDARPVPLDSVSDRWDEKGWKPFAPTMIGCQRDFAYLEWRYLRHPLFRYETAVIEDGDRLGLAVWRVDMIETPGESGLEQIDSMVRLVEFLPVSQANGWALLAEVQRSALAAGAMAIDFYGYHHVINACLCELGFVDLRQVSFGALLPNRFHPLDNKGGAIKSAVKVGFDGPDYLENCDWYWTRSDSDQDRPN